MQNQSLLLSPGRRFMDGMRFGHKFFLVGMVFLLPIVFLLYASYQKLNTDISFAAKERTGLQLIVPAREFEQAVQLHRGRSQMLLAGNKEAAAALADAQKAADGASQKWRAANSGEAADLQAGPAQDKINGQWESAKAKALSGSAEESFQLHSDAIDAVLAYIGLVADNSNLTLDPDLDSFYVMDSVVVNIPDLIDRAFPVVDLRMESL